MSSDIQKLLISAIFAVVCMFTVLFLAGFAYAQIPTCVDALKATPLGPFPCSVLVQWTNPVDTDPTNDPTGIRVERRLNGGAWGKLGGDLAPNVNQLVDGTLIQGTVSNLYEYRTFHFNSAGAAVSSPAAVAFTTIPALVKPPVGGQNLTVTFQGAVGEMLCPACSKGADRKVSFVNDDGTLTISATAITIDYK